MTTSKTVTKSTAKQSLRFDQIHQLTIDDLKILQQQLNNEILNKERAEKSQREALVKATLAKIVVHEKTIKTALKEIENLLSALNPDDYEYAIYIAGMQFEFQDGDWVNSYQ